MRQHLLTIESLTRAELEGYLLSAHNFVEVSTRDLKKVPALRGKTVINLFLEPSTRTRTSFEIAGKRLSADVINISGASSSVVKGETLHDTARTLEAMAPDVLVVRHAESGAPVQLARWLSRTSVVNAGDGMHEHPTQALLDLLTLLDHFGGGAPHTDLAALQNRTIAIVGDVRHSRVARSNIWAHLRLGNRVRLVGPPTLVPATLADPATWGGEHGVEVVHDLRSGIEGADIVMCLRLQLERQKEMFIPSATEYSREFCLSEAVLRQVAPSAVVLHPGPANRGVEISSEVLDGPRSLARAQVTHGVAVRMAVLFALGASAREESIAERIERDVR